MRTDLQLQQDVLAELRWEPRIGELDIAVAVRDGVVTLNGMVDSYVQKYAVERAAERVAGVQAIADDLTVRLPSQHVRTDTDIAHAVATALRWDVEVPHEAIKAMVDDGVVMLDGTVDWHFQRTAAERAVRHLTGVKGVMNRIAIAPRVSPADVSEKIRSALRRNAESEATRIAVDAADGRVTLRGKVHSYADRREIERAAWSAPGVTQVDDLTTVAF